MRLPIEQPTLFSTVSATGSLSRRKKLLTQVTGITQIEKLYLQLLYRCNFDCLHCFHGSDLAKPDSYSLIDIESIVNLFLEKHSITSVTLLGGEPFLHSELPEIMRFIKSKKLKVEICSNGYGITKKLAQVAQDLDRLRVSLEGMQAANDKVRRSGSFAEGIKTIKEAINLGIDTSVTTTINSLNIDDIYEYVLYLSGIGVQEIKLHQLRLVGSAKQNDYLLVRSSEKFVELQARLSQIQQNLGVVVVLDDDLAPGGSITVDNDESVTEKLDRIELQPNGDIYVSCKAVGDKSNAFRYDRASREILYRPHSQDEFALRTPQVRYATLAVKQ
jgi:molybdenum cofactor biosynthesis enzyme MoaA